MNLKGYYNCLKRVTNKQYSCITLFYHTIHFVIAFSYILP